MGSFAGMLRRVADNPVVNIIVAAGIIVASVSEVEQVLVSDFGNIEGEHGMLLFGLLHLLKSIPDLLDALNRGREGLERAKAVTARRDRRSA